jgi:large subunit ribosomal protein L5
VTLNIGTGKEQGNLDKALKLLTSLAGAKPVKCISNKRIPGWGLRPGLPVGAKVTLRRNVDKLIANTLYAINNTLGPNNFDNMGNIAYGVPEYIDIAGAKYDPEIGVMGLQVSITLERPGYRIKRRKIRKGQIHKSHIINKQEAIGFMKEKFKIKISGEE